jgi:hypothetical protein
VARRIVLFPLTSTRTAKSPYGLLADRLRDLLRAVKVPLDDDVF